MRYFLWILFLSVFLSACSSSQETEQQRLERLHNEILTVDSHTDTPLRLVRAGFSLADSHDVYKMGSKVDFPRMKAGGLDAIFMAVFLGQGECDSASYEKANKYAIRIFDSIHSSLKQNSEIAGLALSPKDAYQLEKEGKRAVFIGVENGYPLAHKLENIEDFYNRGARYITLCHTRNNLICDSSTDTISFNGLSDFGCQVVEKMNSLGMMIDVSHVSDSSFYDIIRESKAPIIASHSCARAVCDNPRNLSDDMLRKLAENGGVCQMCILSSYVKKTESNPQADSMYNDIRSRYKDYASLSDSLKSIVLKEWYSVDILFPPNLATVKDVVDHIDHIVKVAGIDHIGIGTDFDGGGGVADCYDVSQMPNITKELILRGYSDKDIEKIWGGNIMRVLTEAEKTAIKMNCLL